MNVINLSPRILIVGITVTTLMSSIGYAWADSSRTPQAQNQTSELVEVFFELPPVADNGAPGGRKKGAGSHSLCQLSDQQTEVTPLIALMPEVPVDDGITSKTYIWGRTTTAHPTFWFYVAYPQGTHVEFVLQDEAENDLYQTVFPIEETPGIIGLTLLAEEAALIKGKSYHWYFNIKCDLEDSTDDFVEGWVERVELNPVLNSQLESAQSLERVSLYAANGLWYDALTQLDHLKEIDPNNQAIATIWTDLLQQVDLDEVSQEIVVRRYNLAN